MPSQSAYYPATPANPPPLVDRGRLTEALRTAHNNYQASQPLSHLYSDACSVALAYERFAARLGVALSTSDLNLELLTMALAAVYPGYAGKLGGDKLDLSSPYLRPAASEILATYNALTEWRSEAAICQKLGWPPPTRQAASE